MEFHHEEGELGELEVQCGLGCCARRRVDVVVDLVLWCRGRQVVCL